MSPKVFIVTGASKGIGAAITKFLLSESHKVVVVARSKGPLEELKRSHPDQVEYLAGDMVDPQISTQLTELAVKSFGRLDGVVINHGILIPRRFADSSPEEWKTVYDINVFSGIALAKAALKELKKSKGCILWMSSGAATNAYGAWGSYGSSKAAVNSTIGHIAVENPDITSVAIAPGRVSTDMQGVIRSEGKNTMDEAAHQNFTEAFDTGELLKPEQVAYVLAKFVADPLKDFNGKFFDWNSSEVSAYQE